MPLKRIGANDVVETGIVVLGREDEEFEISIKNLTFHFRLISESGDKILIFEKPNATTLIVKMNNWPPQLGGVVSRFKVGNLDGRPLYLALSGFEFGSEEKKSRCVTYTFSLGEVVNAQSN